ncbi:MAG: hypothetical protein ACJ8F0_19110 [Xanthobacteraceae bacterium]
MSPAPDQNPAAAGSGDAIAEGFQGSGSNIERQKASDSESTVRYLGIEVDALEISEQTEI